MAEPRSISTAELAEILKEKGVLEEGADLLERNEVRNLARAGTAIFAEVNDGVAYQVTIDLGRPEAIAAVLCSCHGKDLCRHAAAVLILWSHAPEVFPRGRPTSMGVSIAKKRVKKGKARGKDLALHSVTQVSTLIQELGVAGVLSIPADRIEQVRALAASVRAAGLPRLSRNVGELAELLHKGAETGVVEPVRYAEMAADLLLAARRLGRHYEGEPLDAKHEDELLGRIWRVRELSQREDLVLVEYAFLSRETPDGFRVRESRLLDLASGSHFTEKQILPATIAAKREKPSRGRRLLRGASVAVYPGFEPTRVAVVVEGRVDQLDREALEVLLRIAHTGVAQVLSALRKHREDPFAPRRLPIAVRASFVADDIVFDETGEGIPLAPGSALVESLGRAQLRAILGDLELVAGTPVLTVLAAVAEHRRELDLVQVGAQTDLRLDSVGRPLGGAAAQIGTIRATIAGTLVRGTAALTGAETSESVERLRALGLARPADLLASLATASEKDRVEGLLKLDRLLEVALVQLAAPVRREAGSHVPAHDVVVEDWSNGSTRDSVVAAVAPRAGALDVARRALEAGHGRAVETTAIQILEAIGTHEAEGALVPIATNMTGPVALRARAHAALLGIAERRGDALVADLHAAARAVRVPLEVRLVEAARPEERADVARELAALGDLDALPALRRAFLQDQSPSARTAALEGLVLLADDVIVPQLVRALESRRADEPAAVEAAEALGKLADVRGITALVDVFSEGWKPSVINETLARCSFVALPTIVARVERSPGLAERAGIVLAHVPVDDLVAYLTSRAKSNRSRRDFVKRATLYLQLSIRREETRRAVGETLLGLLAAPLSAAERRLRGQLERLIAE